MAQHNFSRREIEAAYREVKAAHVEAAAHANAVRETAWVICSAHRPYWRRFWRCGFQHVWGKLVDEHDFTAIPGYDSIAQQVAELFPEFGPQHAGDVSGTERLWAFLMSPYKPMPRRAAMMAEAMRRLEAERESATWAVSVAFDFGANACELEFA